MECFQKSGFYPKILSCAEMHFLEIRSKVKNHHISEAGVSFEIQFGLWIKIWAEEHNFLHMAATIALTVQMYKIIDMNLVGQVLLYYRWHSIHR